MPRPKLNPTATDRELVKRLAAVGMSQQQIAEHMGIRSVKTLRKHYSQELHQGVVQANHNVAWALYQKASKGDVTAAKYWLANRAGWTESSRPSFQNAVPPPFIVAQEPVQ